jgi:hypothetical protein
MIKPPAAAGQANAATNRPFLQTLLENTWSLKQGVPCSLNGGAYMVYDKDYGRYFVTQGQPQKVPKLPIVSFSEVNPTTVGISVLLLQVSWKLRFAN